MESGEGGTVRERLARVLRQGPATAKDLSRLARVAERDVSEHLDHLARSLARRGEVLRMDPPECLECGFAFPGRTRTKRPGHCPSCRSRRITLPRFWIEARSVS